MSLLLALLFAASDPDFDALVHSLETRTGCEVQTVLTPNEDDYRIAIFSCPHSRIGIVFMRDKAGGWGVLKRVFVGAPVPQGEGI